MIVIYDSDCGICDKFRKTIEKLDVRHEFQFRPLSDTSLYTEYAGLTQQDCEKELKLVDAAGRVLGGVNAVLAICSRLPLLAAIGWVASIPIFRPTLRAIYNGIATNRAKISAFFRLSR